MPEYVIFALSLAILIILNGWVKIEYIYEEKSRIAVSFSVFELSFSAFDERKKRKGLRARLSLTPYLKSAFYSVLKSSRITVKRLSALRPPTPYPERDALKYGGSSLAFALMLFYLDTRADSLVYREGDSLDTALIHIAAEARFCHILRGILIIILGKIKITAKEVIKVGR